MMFLLRRSRRITRRRGARRRTRRSALGVRRSDGPDVLLSTPFTTPNLRFHDPTFPRLHHPCTACKRFLVERVVIDRSSRMRDVHVPPELIPFAPCCRQDRSDIRHFGVRRWGRTVDCRLRDSAIGNRLIPRSHRAWSWALSPGTWAPLAPQFLPLENTP